MCITGAKFADEIRYCKREKQINTLTGMLNGSKGY